MNQLEHLSIPTNGITLHTVLAGPEAGPLVVLLHGFPEHWYSWRKQIPALADAGFRVVAPDQRGYNLSDKPAHVRDYRLDALTEDIVGLIRALGRDQAVIVGHDWGGAVAHRLAMDYPAMVSKLVIMNSPHPRAMARELKRPRQLLKSWYIYFFQVPWLPETILNLAPDYWAGVFFRDTAVNKHAFSDEDLEVTAKANARPRAMRSMINWYRAAVRFPPMARTKQITAPTRIMWAEHDVALSKPLTEGIARWYGADFRIHFIARCGHWVQNEAPDEVNRLLLAFVAH
ncbi:MAG: alpha/beta hydrolase [Chloroflexi bacterium]|nr:alpha/beta hydrolase [Chloroflexota bacterium]